MQLLPFSFGTCTLFSLNGPGVRAHELTYTKRISYLFSLGASFAPTVPIVSAIVTFVAHVASGNSLTAAQVNHAFDYTRFLLKLRN